MPNTPNVALPYPVATDTADVPRDIQALATRADAVFAPTTYGRWTNAGAQVTPADQLIVWDSVLKAPVGTIHLDTDKKSVVIDADGLYDIAAWVQINSGGAALFVSVYLIDLATPTPALCNHTFTIGVSTTARFPVASGPVWLTTGAKIQLGVSPTGASIPAANASSLAVGRIR